MALLYPAGRALLRQSVPGVVAARRAPGRRPGRRPLAVTPTFWSQAVIAEVYSLNAFFCRALFYLLLIWGERALAAALRKG